MFRRNFFITVFLLCAHVIFAGTKINSFGPEKHQLLSVGMTDAPDSKGRVYYNGILNWIPGASLNGGHVFSDSSAIVFGSKILKTTNCGLDWQIVDTSATIQKMDFNGSKGWAVGYSDNGSVILRSSDYGSSWSEYIDSIFSNKILSDVAVCDTVTYVLTERNCIMYATKDGSQWRKINPNLEYSAKSMAWSKDGEWCLVSYHGGVSQSTDRGESYETIFNLGDIPCGLYGLDCEIKGNVGVFVARHILPDEEEQFPAQLFKSVDRGSSWSKGELIAAYSHITFWDEDHIWIHSSGEEEEYFCNIQYSNNGSLDMNGNWEKIVMTRPTYPRAYLTFLDPLGNIHDCGLVYYNFIANFKSARMGSMDGPNRIWVQYPMRHATRWPAEVGVGIYLCHNYGPKRDNDDIRLIRDYLKGYLTLTPAQMWAADVDCDGRVTSADSMVLTAGDYESFYGFTPKGENPVMGSRCDSILFILNSERVDVDVTIHLKGDLNFCQNPVYFNAVVPQDGDSVTITNNTSRSPIYMTNTWSDTSDTVKVMSVTTNSAGDTVWNKSRDVGWYTEEGNTILIFQIPIPKSDSYTTYITAKRGDEFVGRYQYTVHVEIGYPTLVETDNKKPTQFNLLQNYPNPFNPSTTIRYNIGEPGQVKLTIYTITGQEVAMLINEQNNAGEHVVFFDAKMLPSGMYYYRLKTGNQVATKKMLLVK
jgi:hypothetical protein